MGKIEEFGSDRVAWDVIKKFLEEFDKNGQNWQTQYYNKLKEYRNDTNKQLHAKTKLVMYYDVLESEKHRIKEAYQIIKTKYDSLLKDLKQKVLEKAKAPEIIAR